VSALNCESFVLSPFFVVGFQRLTSIGRLRVARPLRVRLIRVFPASSSRRLRAAETRRLAARPTTDATAYDLCLHALPVTDKRRYPRSARAVPNRLSRAIQPMGRPWLSASNCHIWRRFVAGDGPVVLAAARAALARFHEDIGARITLFERCLELDPSFARGWYSNLMPVFDAMPEKGLDAL
jgi:hypothetical protein